MRSDVNYSLTEKCENCFFASDVDNSKQRGTGGKYKFFWILRVGAPTDIQPQSRFPMGGIKKGSASFLTRSWPMDMTRYWNRQCAYFRVCLLIQNNVRSYVPSKVSGNSSKTRRTLGGEQKRRVSTWQCSQRNLWGGMSCRHEINTNVMTMYQIGRRIG
jgi:hypothetical protein